MVARVLVLELVPEFLTPRVLVNPVLLESSVMVELPPVAKFTTGVVKV